MTNVNEIVDGMIFAQKTEKCLIKRPRSANIIIASDRTKHNTEVKLNTTKVNAMQYNQAN